MVSYANMSGVSYAGLTDGDIWELYDVFQQRRLHDKRVIQASITNTPVSQCALMMSHLRPDGLMLEQPTEASAPVFDQEITSNLNPAITREPIDPQSIIGTVADYYDLHMDDLVARTRKRSVSQPRQVAMYLLTNELKLAPTHVGRLLGGRDHATVIHGAGKISGEMNEDSTLRQEVLAIKEAIFA
jgi:hypothetical protein